MSIFSEKKVVRLCLIIWVVAIVIASIVGVLYVEQIFSKKECYPNPLLSKNYVPSTPTKKDYLTFMNFGNNTIANYFYSIKIEDYSSNTYILTIYYNNFSKTLSNYFFEMVVKNPNGGNIVHTSWIGIMRLLTNDNYIYLKSKDINISIYPENISSRIYIKLSGADINLELSGKPFWYNHGKIAEIGNGQKVWGFEILEDVSGYIGKEKVSGEGLFERVNFNIELVKTPYFISWIAINTKNVKGILYRQGEYRDGGLWIDGKYYQPVDFYLSSLNTSGKEVKYLSMIISYEKKDGVYGYIKIYAKGIFYNNFGNVCDMHLQRGDSGGVEEGFSFIDIRTGTYLR